MIDASERLINLALFLAATSGTITAEDIRREVLGYPEEQDDAAFKRMLERDKDTLRSSGLAIESDDAGNYRLDRLATYIGAVSVSTEEAAAITAAAVALSTDPSFPFAEDLRLALAKIAPQVSQSHPDVASVLADEQPRRQGEMVAALAAAVNWCKRTSFDYTNASGTQAPHQVEPYGIFLHSGRWYLVGRDTAKKEIRTYAVARMSDLAVNQAAPKTPDFRRPDGFDVSSYLRLPFQYGPQRDEFDAVLRFSPSHTRKARRLAIRGQVTTLIDGSTQWTVRARSATELARFVIRNGPGLSVESPPKTIAAWRQGLERVEAIHD